MPAQFLPQGGLGANVPPGAAPTDKVINEDGFVDGFGFLDPWPVYLQPNNTTVQFALDFEVAPVNGALGVEIGQNGYHPNHGDSFVSVHMAEQGQSAGGVFHFVVPNSGLEPPMLNQPDLSWKPRDMSALFFGGTIDAAAWWGDVRRTTFIEITGQDLTPFRGKVYTYKALWYIPNAAGDYVGFYTQPRDSQF